MRKFSETGGNFCRYLFEDLEIIHVRLLFAAEAFVFFFADLGNDFFAAVYDSGAEVSITYIVFVMLRFGAKQVDLEM